MKFKVKKKILHNLNGCLIFHFLIFPQPSYWCSSPRVAFLKEKEDDEDAEKKMKGEFIEEEPAGLVSGVKIKHLAKVSDAPCSALILLDS